MSGLDTALSGDPAGCLAAARLLDRRAGELEHATRTLTRHTPLEGDLAGVAGDAYRVRARDLAGSCATLAGHHRGVASALVRFGRDLAQVADQLARCRTVARQQLVLRGDLVVEPGAYATPAQHTTYEQLSREVVAARAAEDGAHFAWQSALAEHTDTPSPVPPWGVGGQLGPMPPPSVIAPPSPGERSGPGQGSGREPDVVPQAVPEAVPEAGPEAGPSAGPRPEPVLVPPTVRAEGTHGGAGATAAVTGSAPIVTPAVSSDPPAPGTTCAGSPPVDRGPTVTSPAHHHVLIGPELEHAVWHAPSPETDLVLDPGAASAD